MGSFAHVWNLFRNKEPTESRPHSGYHSGTNQRPDKMYTYYNSKRSMVGSIYNRISTDVASLDFKHVKLDDEGKYLSTIKGSSLNELLNIEANIDQTGRQFIQDAIHSMCDEGFVALVPIETSIDPKDKAAGYTIESIRVGKIVEWLPKEVRVDLYNEENGLHEQVLVYKSMVAIIENPFYATMNEPNSVLKRLTNKLDLLDIADEKNITGKLDIIIQLPYTIKTTKKQEQADARRKQVEEQMSDSKYGIAYIDAAEKITQLNRPAENQLVAQVENLTSMLYNQLGFTKGIFDGSADEKEILNYYNRTIEPCCNAIVDEMDRKFLTKTARTQGQAVRYYRDVFKLTPISELAELADKLTRNEILSSNEFRGILAFKPHADPKADELRNKNLNVKDQIPGDQNGSEKIEGKE